MPGLVGAIQSGSCSSLQQIFNRMRVPLEQGFQGPREHGVNVQAGWALGRVHHGIFCPDPQLQAGASIQVLFHGDLYNEVALRTSLREHGVEPAPGPAGVLAALYRQEGNQLAERLEGTYCAVVVDEEKGQAILITDRVGSHPLYWFAGSTRFVFATALRCVLRDPAVQIKLNPQALADYLAFGFLIGEKTLAQGVELLPPASTLTVGWKSGLKVSAPERYWHVVSAFQCTDRPKAECFAELIETFSRVVARASQGNSSVGLSLSGGLDSRTILSALDCKNKKISSYTLGVRGCADQVIASQLARIAGTQHTFFELNEGYLGDFAESLRAMIVMTDGMYLSHGLTEMLAYRFLQRSDIRILLRGHGGELAKHGQAWPCHTDEHIGAMRTSEELVPYLMSRLGHVGREEMLPKLFTEPWARQMAGQAPNSLSTALRGIDLSPVNLCSYIYLNEVHRRFTTPSIDLFRSLHEIRLPYVEVDYLKVLLRMPPSWREGVEIHREIVRRNLPTLLKVRNSNTGAAADASPLVESVLDKVNTALKRLNVYGYRHYHNFDAWMKKRLIETVESILLSPESLDRGMIQKATLRRLIHETRSGTGNHGYLFQVLLLVEIWLRENA